MKKSAIVLVLAILFTASVTCLPAFAEPPAPHQGPPPPHGGAFFGGHPGPPPGPPPPHMGGGFGLWDAPPPLMEKLQLTDDQRKQMRQAYVDFQDKTRKTRNALMGLHDEKRTMLISGKIDQAKLAKIDEDITKLSSEVMAEELLMKRQHLAKLTPEQVNLLADFLAKKEMKHGPKMRGR
ncbi:Spy/CpxP family protein refolding chaperone [Desulfomonile tiedjei]|uniref:P pilus assembly/Cpx signaling pathway, periplasmic inhibitor/zinc-resistance associated protein n=1 Tax=Desulfomonile tiedjei (strain ATCC 49306 / DSM 6799 / DCB-1) TaxID=706587 RepID=I4C9E4_DESTA|nr:periplasmic heavy metal sensor [Desulfomonile tiedjei]AFM26185.1 P pilus assembly/Cpx signaling pathway, periplasmic inhibitor/zinc-resistance associated protein [Desulfomonile tiedjei DSM 6799]